MDGSEARRRWRATETARVKAPPRGRNRLASLRGVFAPGSGSYRGIRRPGRQRVQGTLQIWAEPFVSLRVPKLYNLRTDPYERADITSNTYYQWLMENDYLILAATTLVAQFLQTFAEFPPRQKAASFTIDQVVAKMESALTSGR